MTILETVVTWLLTIILMVLILTIAGLGYFHFRNGDFVYLANTTTYVTSDTKCFVNDVQVNCSDFPTKDSHFYYNGSYQMNGVCPGVSNESVADCIKDAEAQNET